MPFPSLPHTGAEKGKNILNTVLFHFAELPMHLPQKSLTLPSIPLPSQLPGPSKVGILTPFCLGQPSQQELQQGKVIPVFSHCLGTMQGSSAFKSSALEFVWVTWSFSSSVICFVPIQSPPLHTDTSARFNICTFYVAKSFSSEKHFIRVCLVRFWWHFQTYFCASSLVKKKKILFPSWQPKVFLPDLNQPAQQRRKAVDRTCSITQSNDDHNERGKPILSETLWQICSVCQPWNLKLNPCASIHSSLLPNPKIMEKQAMGWRERLLIRLWRAKVWLTLQTWRDWWHGDVAVSQIGTMPTDWFSFAPGWADCS